MKKVLIALSVGLNLLTGALLVFFFNGGGAGAAQKYFLEPMHQRWVSQFEVLPIREGDIVFLGDSITEGGAWADLFPGLPVRNRGIGGDVTAGVLARLHQITSGHPSKVFLLIGTNDLSAEKPVADIVDNIVEIVTRINTESPDTQVYVQSVLPRAQDYREQIEALNDQLQKSIAGKATWINLYPLFVDDTDGSIRDDLSNDELHLLGPGYLLWRDELVRYLNQ